jgi:hypothetical protein
MKATLFRNNGLITIIDEQELQRIKPVSSEHKAITFANKQGLKLVNETSPKHAEFVAAFQKGAK